MFRVTRWVSAGVYRWGAYESPISWNSNADDSDGVPGLCGTEGGGIVRRVSLVHPEAVNLGFGSGSAGRCCLGTGRKSVPLFSI